MPTAIKLVLKVGSKQIQIDAGTKTPSLATYLFINQWVGGVLLDITYHRRRTCQATGRHHDVVFGKSRWSESGLG